MLSPVQSTQSNNYVDIIIYTNMFVYSLAAVAIPTTRPFNKCIAARTKMKLYILTSKVQDKHLWRL